MVLSLRPREPKFMSFHSTPDSWCRWGSEERRISRKGVHFEQVRECVRQGRNLLSTVVQMEHEGLNIPVVLIS